MPGYYRPGTNLAPQQVNAYDLAGLYLTNAGLPNTAKNRVALGSWFLAESAHGTTPGTIVMYNNNPLNITTHGSNYHQFGGNNLHFANYESPTSGASAWWNLLNSNPRYTGIITALRSEDQVGLASAVGRSPWGTSTQGILNVLKANGVDLSTGNSGNLGDTRIVYGQSFQIGSTFTQKDADRLYNAIVGTGQTSGFDLGISNILLRGVINDYVGHKVSDQMFSDMGKSIMSAGGMASDQFNPIPKVAPGTNPLDTITNFLDPTKAPQRLLHIGAILLGVGMVGAGVWILIKGVNAPSLNSGGSGGGGDIVINENFDAEDEAEDVVEAVPAAPKQRRSRAKPIDWDKERAEARAQEERMAKANQQGSSTTYQGAAPAS